MAKTIVNINDTLNTWREKTNDISIDVGDITLLTTDEDSDVVGSINSIDSNLGARENLTTNDKRSVVQAVNELDSDVGDITTLDTETHASVVRAINELELNHNKIDSDLGGSFGTNTPRDAINVRTSGSNGFRHKQTFASALNELADSMGRAALTTTAQTIKGSLREHETDIGNMVFTGLSSTDISAALRELRTEMGWHSDLTTSATSNLVAGINELRVRLDSVDADIDQPVKNTSNVLFPQVTLGTQAAADNSVYTNSGVARTGDYTVDVSNNIVLDADNATWTLADAGTTRFQFTGTTAKTLATGSTGDFTLDVAGNIELNADGSTWTLKDNTVNRWVFSGTTDKTLQTGTTGNFLLDVPVNITLDADGGTVNIADGGVNQFAFVGGVNKTLAVGSGNLTVDVAGDINLDAGSGVWKFNKNGSTVARLADSGNTMVLEMDSGGLHIHAADDIALDAGGGDIVFERNEEAEFQFSFGTNKRMSVPSGDLLADVAGKWTVQSNTGNIVLSGNGADNIAYSLGDNQIAAYIGNATFDVEGDITLDAGGGDVLLKDDGVQYGALTQSSNNLVVKSGSVNAVTFSQPGVSGTTKRKATFNGPVYLDSALSADITGKSVAGALNQLDTEVDTLQTLIGGTGASYSITNLSATTVKTQIQEIATELYTSGVSFTGLSANNFRAAANELRVEVGDVTLLDSAIRPATANTVGAINNLHQFAIGIQSGLEDLTDSAFASIGSVLTLKTAADTIVSGINELNDSIGSGGLTTTSKTLIGAINEINGWSTTNLSEGTNKYYTDARARAAVSAGNTGTGYGSIGYNSTTGGLTYTRVSDANIRGSLSVTANTGLSYNASTGVFYGVNATTTTKGVASFTTANFTTSNGSVALKTAGIAGDNLQNDAVTYDKMQNVSTAYRLLGATTPGGQITEVQVETNFIANDAVTYGKIQNISTANRLLGSTTSNGPVTEVQVQTNMIADNAVTSSKLANPQSLTIRNSVGTILFTITGAGS